MNTHSTPTPTPAPGSDKDRNGYFYYQYQNQHFGNQTSTFFVLFLAFVTLVALLRSESRYRKLLENLLASADSSGLKIRAEERQPKKQVLMFGLIPLFNNTTNNN